MDGQSDPLSIQLQHFCERFRGHPHAVIDRVDVYIKAQNTKWPRVTLEGNASKCRRSLCHHATRRRGFLLGTQAGPVGLPRLSIPRQLGCQPGTGLV